MISRADEVAANLERAEQSIQAARDLIADRYYDFAASRAYYGAFYAATAALLDEGVDLSKQQWRDCQCASAVRQDRKIGQGARQEFELAL